MVKKSAWRLTVRARATYICTVLYDAAPHFSFRVLGRRRSRLAFFPVTKLERKNKRENTICISLFLSFLFHISFPRKKGREGGGERKGCKWWKGASLLLISPPTLFHEPPSPPSTNPGFPALHNFDLKTTTGRKGRERRGGGGR